MSKPSPVSLALTEAFVERLLPLLRRIGFERSEPQGVKPGLVAAMAVRRFGDQRRAEATLWCDGATGGDVRFRFDVVEPSRGVELRKQIDLKVPWPDPAYPNPTSLDFSGREFRPHESTDRLRMAIAFLAGAFAANAEEIGRAVPELAEPLRATSAEPGWKAASEEAAALWTNRHVRGDVEDRPAPGKVVFVGSNLLSVDADGVRLTFRFDTGVFDRNQPVSVSGWFTTAAGTRAASRLTSGGTTWTFDLRGQLVSSHRKGGG